MSEPTPGYGAPSLGPIDRVSAAPIPNTRKDTPMSGHDNGLNYGNTASITWRDPFPVNEVLVKEQPAPQPQPEQK